MGIPSLEDTQGGKRRVALARDAPARENQLDKTRIVDRRTIGVLRGKVVLSNYLVPRGRPLVKSG